MTKLLKKRAKRGQKNLQLYSCKCRGCGSVPADDYERVYSHATLGRTGEK